MSKYLDLDAILAEDERVPCKFLVDAEHLGHLHPTVSEEDLPKDVVVELPLWLGKAFSDRNMVKIEMPKHYGSKMRDAILAGASAVDLRDYSHYYFVVGLKLAKMVKPADEDLLRIMRKAFTGERFRDLCVLTLTNSQDDMTDFCQKLTSTELFIFNEGLQAARDLARWKSSESNLLQKASILGKRKSNSKTI